jgi:hypothetical protein
MASEHDRDEHYPRDVEDEGIEDTHVRAALGDLAFLRPDDAPGHAEPSDVEPSDVEPMPEWAWARISSALAAEQPAPARRPSRLLRWGGGLVAASVAVLAVGVGVTAFQGSSSGGAVVAGDPGAAALSEGSADAAVAGAAAFEAAAPAAEDFAASRQLSFASMVPPVFRLIDSDTAYTATGLKDQVEEVMASTGMPASTAAVEQAMAAEPEPMVMSDVPADGFTESAQSLRDCITKLTQQETSTALLVDRSTFEGSAAGVIVTPDVPEAPAAPMEEVEVTVVDPECDLIMKVWIRLTQ